MSNLSQKEEIQQEASEIGSELERVKFDLTESKVPVKFIEEFSGFSFEGITIPAMSQGGQVEIPFFSITMRDISFSLQSLKSEGTILTYPKEKGFMLLSLEKTRDLLPSLSLVHKAFRRSFPWQT